MAVLEIPCSCVLVIFGASGDLTRRKLLPALYDLYVSGLMPKDFAILGVSRTSFSDDDYRGKALEFAEEFSTEFKQETWDEFAKCIHYHAADSTKLADFDGLKSRISELSKEHNTGENLLLYLSMAPQLYERTINNIGQANMITEGKAWCSLDRNNRAWQRIVVEKPFGNDPASAAHLNRVLGRVFEEESIYRIDHYLGKETVQNLLVFRFGNTIFEPIWNRNYIDHIQITASETVGVEGRGGYYDSPGGGAMRDMIQSHLLQVLAVVAMEPPVSLKADDIRMMKNQALHAARIPKAEDVPNIAVRGQYGQGQVNGKSLVNYRDAEGVDPESQTDTYAALTVFLDTWRWHDVPFYVRSGKAMAQKLTQVVIQFKQTPHMLFGNQTGGKALPPNKLVINIQPDEGIDLSFEAKVPGMGMKIKTVEMDFDYAEHFQTQPPQAYATLLLDAMRGDQTLYKHRDEIEVAWNIVQPVLDYWKDNPSDELPNYAAGTWGPSDTDVMMGKAGRKWHNPSQD